MSDKTRFCKIYNGCTLIKCVIHIKGKNVVNLLSNLLAVYQQNVFYSAIFILLMRETLTCLQNKAPAE